VSILRWFQLTITCCKFIHCDATPGLADTWRDKFINFDVTCDRIATLCNTAQRRQDFGHQTFAAFVDLRAAFDSLSRPALWLLLTRLGIPDKIVRLFRVLYDNSVSCVRTGGTYLDFADDVSLLAELLELLVPILETIASEAASRGFEVNWQKTKIQALGCREDMPLTIKVQGQDVMVVEEFVYLGSSTGSTCIISRRSAITRAAMQSLENQIWRSRLAISTKLKLYNTYILPIFLYGSDCWVISKTNAHKIDALHSTSGVCVCCLASGGASLCAMMMYGS